MRNSLCEHLGATGEERVGVKVKSIMEAAKLACAWALLVFAAGAMFAAGAAVASARADSQGPMAGLHSFGGDSQIARAGLHRVDDVETRLRRLSPVAMDEVIWLARCMYSESDRLNEQELVAWVVRNRVETAYRGRTYREVILEAKQFSAFNEPTKRREHIMSLSSDTPLLSWQRTLEKALDVYQAPTSDRPFAQTVRHFYSPISMVGGGKPHWADGDKALSSARLGVDRRRFIFFDDVDAHLADAEPTGPSVGGETAAADRKRGDGFRFNLKKPSGKVARPRRPSISSPRNQ